MNIGNFSLDQLPNGGLLLLLSFRQRGTISDNISPIIFQIIQSCEQNKNTKGKYTLATLPIHNFQLKNKNSQGT